MSPSRSSGRAVTLLVSAALSLTGCELTRMKWGSDVSFELDRQSARVGESVAVRFSILKREPGWRYSVALVPDETPLTDHSSAVEIPDGSRALTLQAKTPGLHAVRVYRTQGGETRYVAGGKVSITP